MYHRRTRLQKNADATDILMFRLINRLDNLCMEVDRREQPMLREAINSLRVARTPVRELMHPQDRERSR